MLKNIDKQRVPTKNWLSEVTVLFVINTYRVCKFKSTIVRYVFAECLLSVYLK